MQGSIYNYDQQCWTQINTQTDQRIETGHYRTLDGVEYQVNASGEYRNYVSPEDEATLISAGL